MNLKPLGDRVHQVKTAPKRGRRHPLVSTLHPHQELPQRGEVSQLELASLIRMANRIAFLMSKSATGILRQVRRHRGSEVDGEELTFFVLTTSLRSSRTNCS